MKSRNEHGYGFRPGGFFEVKNNSAWSDLMSLIYVHINLPWKSKDFFFNGFSVKTIVLVRVYYQQILGNVILWSLTSRVYIITLWIWMEEFCGDSVV